MPKINEYQSQVASPAFTVNVNTNLAQPGLAAKAAADFGETVGRVTDRLYQRQAQSEVSDLNAKFAEARAEWATRIDDDAATGNISTQKIQEDFQDYSNKMNEGISTREGREFFERQNAQLGGYVLKNSARAEAQVAGAKAVNNYLTALNVDSNLLQKRPGDFDETLKSSMAFIDAQQADGTLDYGNADKLRKATGLELSKNAMRGYIRQSPYEAQKLLDKGGFDKYLDPDAKNQLNNQIKAEIESRQVQYLKTLALKEKDPWQFVAKTGKMEGFKPLDLENNPADSFNQRALFIKDQNEKNGIDLPFVSPREAEHYSKALMQMPTDQAVTVLKNLDTNVADEYKAKFAMQIFKDEPSLAAAVMVAGDSPMVAQKILNGMTLLRKGDGGKAIQPPSEDAIQTSFDAYAGSAIVDPGARKAAREAINAHMVQSMVEKGQSDFKGFTEQDFMASAEAVMGPTVQMGKMESVSFRGKTGEFLDRNEFLDLFYGLNDKKIEAVQGDVPRTMGGEPLNMDKAKRRMTLQSAGDGLYYMFMDGDRTKPAWGKDKKPFILNLRLIEKLGGKDQQPVADESLFGSGLGI